MIPSSLYFPSSISAGNLLPGPHILPLWLHKLFPSWVYCSCFQQEADTKTIPIPSCEHTGPFSQILLRDSPQVPVFLSSATSTILCMFVSLGGPATFLLIVATHWAEPLLPTPHPNHSSQGCLCALIIVCFQKSIRVKQQLSHFSLLILYFP